MWNKNNFKRREDILIKNILINNNEFIFYTLIFPETLSLF